VSPKPMQDKEEMTAKTTKSTDSPLQIWDKVEIVIDDGREQSVYISRVEDINDSGIIITKPNWVRGGQGLTFNTMVYVQFKKPDAMYRFSAQMRPYGHKTKDLIRLYDFGETRRVQRRQFVRIRFITKLRYWLFKDHDGNTFEEEKWKESVSEDISAGGILIRSNDDITADDLLVLRIRQYDPIGIPPFVAARCCRLTKVNEQDYAALEFITADCLNDYFTADEVRKLPPHIQKFNAQVQNNLVRFVFEEQVRDRQKGLL
jgi:c-di-GMP-binding flagellar brake protein YcgR